MAACHPESDCRRRFSFASGGVSEIDDLVAAGVGWRRADDEWAAESDNAMVAALIASARPKRCVRRPSLARALKEAERAGLTVKRATIDGVLLEFGPPEAAGKAADDEVETWIKKQNAHAH
jgi:hypothetical protein